MLQDLTQNACAHIVSILLIALMAAYCPQIHRIITSETVDGISPYFWLFNIIYSNVQLGNALLLAAYSWPNDRDPVLQDIADGYLRGEEAFGAILGFGQIAIQWFFSMTM
jgi:hypothetical protein